LLQAELPLKKAAALAAEIHGVKKNALYKYALEQQIDKTAAFIGRIVLPAHQAARFHSAEHLRCAMTAAPRRLAGSIPAAGPSRVTRWRIVITPILR
ncbi:hypothetical protein FK514_27945, partial [Klebsiella pneumoniae]|nr:hypothetical protein [Klebsiella pneumoniae]